MNEKESDLPTKTLDGKKLKLSSKISESFVCYHCNNKIKEGETYVCVGTHIGVKNIKTYSKYYYHLDCWKDFFNVAVKNRLGEVQKQAIEMIKSNPMLKNLNFNFDLIK